MWLAARFGNVPGLFGAMATLDGADPSHMRQGSVVTTTQCEIFVEEETCSDSELGHTTEKVSVFAIDMSVPGQPAVSSHPPL